MSIAKLKTKARENYNKSPRTIAAFAVLGGASALAALGVVFGLIEADTAVSVITRLASFLVAGA